MAITAESNVKIYRKRYAPIQTRWYVAFHDFRCEGTDPIWEERFVEGHRDIARGERFLRATWETPEGIAFHARHCMACAQTLGVRDT